MSMCVYVVCVCTSSPSWAPSPLRSYHWKWLNGSFLCRHFRILEQGVPLLDDIMSLEYSLKKKIQSVSEILA